MLIKVPSHIGIAGNDRVDELAEEGRKAPPPPLYYMARDTVPGPIGTPTQRTPCLRTGWSPLLFPPLSLRSARGSQTTTRPMTVIKYSLVLMSAPLGSDGPIFDSVA